MQNSIVEIETYFQNCAGKQFLIVNKMSFFDHFCFRHCKARGTCSICHSSWLTKVSRPSCHCNTGRKKASNTVVWFAAFCYDCWKTGHAHEGTCGLKDTEEGAIGEEQSMTASYWFGWCDLPTSLHNNPSSSTTIRCLQSKIRDADNVVVGISWLLSKEQGLRVQVSVVYCSYMLRCSQDTKALVSRGDAMLLR